MQRKSKIPRVTRETKKGADAAPCSRGGNASTNGFVSDSF